MKSIIITIITFLISIVLIPQDFSRSVGIRGGIFNSFTYKKLYNDEKAFELVGSINGYSIRVVGLREFHKPITMDLTDKLFFYSGYGVHVGLNNNRNYHFPITSFDTYVRRHRIYPVIGLDAALGLEYRVIRYPFTIGIDYIPYFDLFGQNYFNWNLSDIACSVKYTF